MKDVLCEHCGKWTKPTTRKRRDYSDRPCRRCGKKWCGNKDVALCSECLPIVQFAYRIKNGQKKKKLDRRKHND